MNTFIIILLCVLLIPLLYGFCWLVAGSICLVIEHNWPGNIGYNRDQCIAGMSVGAALCIISAILAGLVMGLAWVVGV